mgnify:CR=1 FL=1
MISTALTLLEESKSGKKLTSSERRSVVYYLKAIQPEITDLELANTFATSISIIKKDQLEIRKTLSNELKQTTVDLIIADVHDAVKRTLKKLENNVAILEQRKQSGSDSYTRAALAVLDGWTKYYKISQEMGIVPKDTTPEITTEYHWVAGVDEQGKAYTEQKIITKEKIKNVITETDNFVAPGSTAIIQGTE